MLKITHLIILLFIASAFTPSYAVNDRDSWQQFKADKAMQELDAQFEESKPEPEVRIVEKEVIREVEVIKEVPVPISTPRPDTVAAPDSIEAVTVESGGNKQFFGVPVYLKASDQSLYLHTSGGSKFGGHNTLHPCPKGKNHGNCQWVLEPSTTRAGAYYLKASDQSLYLSTSGGSKFGGHNILHPCPKANDHGNCQWVLEPSTTRAGAYYLKASDQSLYLHTSGGSKFGGHNTLHPCPKGKNHGNCQWVIETSSGAGVAHSSNALSYPRGVGEIPNQCSSQEEFEEGLCYDRCRSGFSGGLTICASNCPAGFRNDPLHCGKPGAYGRGKGYPIHFGELDNDGMFKRCRAENGQNGCEQCLLVVYPKCRAGFKAAGCNLCSPKCPSGMKDIGVSCEKSTYDRGVGRIPSSCRPGQENNAGLCYAKCQSDFSGVGPVCWKKIDTASLKQSALRWQGEWKKIETTYRSLVDVVFSHIESVMVKNPAFPVQALAAYHRKDADEIQRLVDFKTLRQNLYATGIINANVSQSDDRATHVAKNPATEMFSSFQSFADSLTMPISIMSSAHASPSGDDTCPTSEKVKRGRAIFCETKEITFSVSPFVMDISLLGGFTAEFGFAWELGNSRRYTFLSHAWTAGVSAGADASVSVGLWFVAPDKIDGPAAGFVVAASKAAGASLTFWFNEDTGEFLGFQIAPQVGLSLEAEFIRGTTEMQQF